MYCPSCGKEINAGLSFCNHCGARLSAADPRVVPASSFNLMLGAVVAIPSLTIPLPAWTAEFRTLLA